MHNILQPFDQFKMSANLRMSCLFKHEPIIWWSVTVHRKSSIT